MKPAILILVFASITATTASALPASDPVSPKGVCKAQPFDLADVRLLDGPFRETMLRDKKYLLDLDADRLLHMFRVTAGLPSSAEPYGGWEAPKGELRGHSMGHYLSACALMFASTGDANLKTKADHIVAELAKCQEAMPSQGYNKGFLSAYPESFFDRVDACKPVWAPYYTLHKILAGLLEVHDHCGNKQALDIVVKMADWLKLRIAKLSHEQQQNALRNEHGGINEAFANLYAITGNPEHLKLAMAFNHEFIFDPLVRGEDKLNGLHANTQIPKITGAAREYELTGEKKFGDVAKFFWERVALHRSYCIGGHSDREHFHPIEESSKHLSPATAETCNTYNMLKLTRHVFAWEPSARAMDFYERALFNHILASQDPKTGMPIYFASLKPGHFKSYSTSTNSFWCCTGTGMENHSKYGDTIYFYDNDSLYVNLFIASELTWKEKGLVVRQETKFPESDTTRLTFERAKPVELALRIRRPAWAKDMLVTVNGDKVAQASSLRSRGERRDDLSELPGAQAGSLRHFAPSGYVELRRTWKSGDKVDVRMPMTLRIETMPDDLNVVAVLYGPIVLAGELGTVGLEKINPYVHRQLDLERHPVPEIPTLICAPDKLLAHIEPVSGKPLTFRTRGIGRPNDVTLSPYYRLHHQRLAVYWPLLDEEGWKKKLAAKAIEEARRKAYEARILDEVQPGEQQPETDHGFKGEKTNAGEFHGRKWRDAHDSWFSYEVKLAPGAPMTLVCTYWGSDSGNRVFDILVDGQKIATQKLEKNKPNLFFDVEYPIPAKLTAGKQRVTIKFQAQSGKRAGGLFGLRVMKGTAEAKADGMNLALFATPATSFVSGHETLDAINDGFEPRGVNDHSHGCYGNWPKTGTQWVQYEWSQPVSTWRVDVYWWDDARGVRLPKACRVSWWDGSRFVAVKDTEGLGVAGGRWNTTTFAEVTTTKLRLEMDGNGKFSTGIIEWKVYDSGKTPKFAPRVTAGPDRVVVLPAKTYLHGEVRGGKDSDAWGKESGPGTVTFADAHALETTAQFSGPGDYALKLTAANGEQRASDTLKARVEASAPKTRLEPVATHAWKIDSTFWSERLKQQIVNWIPHCIAKLSEPGLKEGGFENFIEAADKLAGRPHKPHVGPPWSNAYTLNTVEAMCLALLVDAQGDAELARTQAAIRAKLDEWIPIILAAQEPDGYLQTRFTLGTAKDNGKPPARWTIVGDHEGYVAGYFMDAAVAHFWLTGGKDRRLYDAAKKLADCWCANIGPAPKKHWYDGHEEIEQALVRFGRLVNEVEGAGKSDRYIRLSKFLLDCRGGGSSYDQSHVPVVQQYEALGHAVRASYCYSGMADIAMETGDAEYHSAVKSLWNNLVNAKLYITGGIGSGETAEGFGKNFSLPNNAYSESCSDCGQLFFQHKMNLAYHESRYADLMEETLYNAILGSVDLPAKNFTYTNPLDQTHERYGWHGCPCCVGNIPRTLLMLPTWMYARSADGVFVNLYIGSTVHVAPDLEIVQRTDYPWKCGVELAVNPATPKKFSLRLRVPNRNVSALYTATPKVDVTLRVTVSQQDGHHAERDDYHVENGYAVITREWKAGDIVRFELPLRVQRVKADERIAADRGRVALRYGPLIYNIESVDQNLDSMLKPDAELAAQWEPNLLGGVVAIRGKFADGSPLTAIPNYARNNRGGRSIVWIKSGE